MGNMDGTFSANELVRLFRDGGNPQDMANLYRSLVEQTNDIPFFIDSAGICLYIAPHIRGYGYTENIIVGRNFADLIYPDDLEQVLADMKKTAETGAEFPTVFRVDTPEFGIRFFEEVGKPIWDSDGGLAGILGNLRDITERKHVEEQLRAEKKKAEELAYEAETASRVKSDFLANMSHEIRTPLNAVIGFTDLLEDSDLSAEYREYASYAGDSARKLLSMVNDILSFSKLESGRETVRREEVNVPRLLKDTLGVMKYMGKRKNLTMELTLADDLPVYFRTDKIKLQQILLNLLSNAVKFTHEGTISVTAGPVISEKYRGISFSISDTGIGIPESLQDRIFDSFTQGDASITREYDGTGLGLAIVKHLVTLLRGSISLSSTEGRGSTFTITLPILDTG